MEKINLYMDKGPIRQLVFVVRGANSQPADHVRTVCRPWLLGRFVDHDVMCRPYAALWHTIGCWFVANRVQPKTFCPWTVAWMATGLALHSASLLLLMQLAHSL